MAFMEPLEQNRWSPAAARHLLNRAAFGAPHGRIETLYALGLEGAVESLLEGQGEAWQSPEPGFLLPAYTRGEVRELTRGLSADERRRARQKHQQKERDAIGKLQAWWLRRMVESPHPLREKMALFWHGHFATEARKVKGSRHNHQLIQVFLEHGLGNFRSLLLGVAQSPAMLLYLDNMRSTKERPNENWARELLELFTLGEGQYKEGDIKAAARAFTGWTFDGPRFDYAMASHDFGVKSFLGKTGPWDGWDIVHIILEQDAAAEFIVAKLWRFLAYDEPEQYVVRRLARTLRKHDYALKPVLRQILRSGAFYSDKAMATQVKSPVQFLVQLCGDLGVPAPPYAPMARAAAQLGQHLLNPPNVKGWEGNHAWINANSLLLRFNMPARLLAAANREGTAADPASVLRSLEFETAGEFIDAAAKRFLCRPLGGRERNRLVEVLGAEHPDARFRPGPGSGRQIIAMLQLLTSTAEYQLC